MFPFLLPALGAGIGALVNKKNRFKGALQGGAAGLGLGGLTNKFKINGIAGPIEMGENIGPVASGAKYAAMLAKASGKSKALSTLKGLGAIAPLAIGAFGAANSPQPEPQLPPLNFNPQPMPISPLGQYQGRPFAPAVMNTMELRQPFNGGY